MSEQIADHIDLHKEGKIDDSDLNKALNGLKIPSELKIQDGASTSLDNLHKRRRNNKKPHRQRSKYKKDYGNAMNELKQLHSRDLVSKRSELKSVD